MTIPGEANNENTVNSGSLNNGDGVENMEVHNFTETSILEETHVSANDRPEFLDDEDDSDEDNFVVTIGEIKPNLPFHKQNRTAGTSGTIDLDAHPTLKDGTPIYDLDLATMEDKPWRKPGADITDYFNYGFNEETWNQYCERQKKFRSEFGTDQSAINKAILSNIQITGPAQVLPSTFSGGRQLVNLAGGHDAKLPQQSVKPQKIVVDLSKPPPSITGSSINVSDHLLTSVSSPVPLIRTVINESGIVTRRESSSNYLSSFKMEMESTNTTSAPQDQDSHKATVDTVVDSTLVKTPPTSVISSAASAPPQSIESIDFSKPPPFGGPLIFDPVVPPPSVSQFSTQPTNSITQESSHTVQPQLPRITSVPIKLDLPPGVDEPEGPPGVLDIPPGISDLPPGISQMNFSQPPSVSQLSYNPSHTFVTPSSAFTSGLPISHQQSLQYSGPSRPNPLFQPSFRHPFGGFGAGRFHDRIRIGRGPPRIDDRSSDSDTESSSTRRKRRRSRTKSRSPDNRRHKDEKRKDRDHKDKEGKKKKDKEKDKKDKHKSHRSPSAKKEKTIKKERSSEHGKESYEKETRRRSSPSSRTREKEASTNKIEISKVKIERGTPEKE